MCDFCWGLGLLVGAAQHIVDWLTGAGCLADIHASFAVEGGVWTIKRCMLCFVFDRIMFASIPGSSGLGHACQALKSRLPSACRSGTQGSSSVHM